MRRSWLLVVLLAACGAPDPTTPPDDVGGFEEPVPVCEASAAGCEECLVHVAPLDGAFTECQQSVCAQDPSCCHVEWGERCAQLADRCLSLSNTCPADASFGQPGGVTVAAHGLNGVRTVPIDDGWIASMAWGDLHGEGWPELATVGECQAKIFLAQETTLIDAIDVAPVAGCVVGEVGPKFDGKRVRWTDLDRDRDLDVLYVGAGGLGWIRQDAGGFSDGGPLIAASDGTPSDAIVFDLDGDFDLDLIVTFDDHPARIYRQGEPGVFALDDTWASALPSALRGMVCNGVLYLAGATGVEASFLDGDGVGGAAFPPGPGIPDVGPSIDVACLPAGAAFLETAGALVVVRTLATWRSDQAPDPVTFDGRGIAVGNFVAGDGSDLIVSVGGPDAPYVLYGGANTGFPFYVSGSDVAPGIESGRVVISPTSGFR